MKKRAPVSEIMTTKIIALNRSDNLEKAEQLFKQYNIRHIPVVTGDMIIGMLSYTDLLRISFTDNFDENNLDTVVYNMFSIEQVMAKNIVNISPNTTIKEAAEILAKKEFHALPVVENSSLVGIVTTTDLINYLIDQF